jgi:hypothetical protein
VAPITQESIPQAQVNVSQPVLSQAPLLQAQVTPSNNLVHNNINKNSQDNINNKKKNDEILLENRDSLQPIQNLENNNNSAQHSPRISLPAKQEKKS